MKGHTVLIVGGVVLAGLFVVYVVQSGSTTTSGSGLSNSSGNFWGFATNLVHSLEKAAPSWFEPKPPTDAELNLYPSSSGFADHG